jgi:hypothetical protein
MMRTLPWPEEYSLKISAPLSNWDSAVRLSHAASGQPTTVPKEAMKYACLVYQEVKKLDALSQTELDALVGACVTWVEELKNGGHHVFSAGLQSFRSAVSVRNRNGKTCVSDGPFTETKELLGGFTIIEARDLNEAIQFASTLPASRIGTIEVRPVLEPNVELTDAFDRKIGAAMRRRGHL